MIGPSVGVTDGYCQVQLLHLVVEHVDLTCLQFAPIVNHMSKHFCLDDSSRTIACRKVLMIVMTPIAFHRCDLLLSHTATSFCSPPSEDGRTNFKISAEPCQAPCALA
jgi:hypothetical protein